METPPKALLRHFSSLFRQKASGHPGATLLPEVVLRHLSRKALIDMIKSKHDGKLPEGIELAEMESRDLLNMVGNEFLIISHITGQWGLSIQGTVAPPKAEPAPAHEEEKPPRKKS